MKYLFMVVFVAFFAASPVYLFDAIVLPELATLESSYSSYDQTAQDIAAGKTASR